ncbi:hypothetical protein RHSIM_Rhsim10G0017100 [Rhododendron simsii]|uniref:Uncharacterized protein n=1 Tax=Rhododendron simsii TaxID=118357 RepID=A0A834GF35_RHOSS|nr:hypothetical protein RHSIM_Rhsim10G0017100 [Rhododendron simsii]
MATEADIPHPVSRPKEVEGKELTCGELSDIIVSENDTVIPTEGKNGEHEALAKKEPEEKNGTHCTVSITEDQPESDTAVCEKTGQAQEQDNESYAEEGIPFLAKTTDERTTEMEDDSVSAKSMGSARIEKESANNDALEQEMSTPPQMNENGVSSTTKLENCSEIGESESSKDENSSNIVIEKDKSEYEMTVNKASEGAIMELEESTKTSEGISKESAETEKGSAELEAEGDTHGSDATEGQSISTPTDKTLDHTVPLSKNHHTVKQDIKSVEDGENPISAPESTVEDKSKRACPEINWTNIEEEINNDENQTTNPIKEQASAKQLLREIERGDESVINKEQTMEEESCTKELHLIPAMDKNHETINKVMDLHLTPTQGLQVTEVAEDLNQEFEAPPPRKALEEEKVIEKPVDLSSSESLASEDKIITEKIEETDDCDDKTDIAPSVETEESILGEANLNDELVKTFDTSSEAKGPEMVKTADTRQQDEEVDNMKLEENSIMMSDLLTHEHEKAETVGMCEEKSDAIDFEVEKVPDAVSESEVQGAKENDESEIVTKVTVGEIDTRKIEEQIRDAPEALSEQLNQVVKSDGKGEIALEQTFQAEKIATLCDEEDSETKTTIEKTEDGCIKKEDTEVETNEIEEKNEGPSEALSEPIDQGVEAASKDEIAAGLTLQAEKIEEQLQVLSYALPSNDENAETTATIEQTEDGCKRNEDAEDDTNEIEDASEGLSEPINQFVEATAKDENAPSPTIEAEKIEEQSQITSSVVLSSEEDGGTAITIEKTADECTKKDDTEVDTPVTTDGATPGVVSQTCESANSAIVDKSDADMVKFEETETLEAVSEPKGRGFEEIHESDTRSTAEITDTGKIEEEIRANEKISDQGAENGTTIKKIEDGSTKKVEAEVDNIKLEETTVVLSEFPSTENANQERVNKVTDLDRTSTQGLQVMASDNPTEMTNSEVAEDLNQEMEATTPRKALEEEIQVIEKPVNLSSSEFLATDEKINKEKKEETEDFDNKTDIAQATEVSILGEVNLNNEPAKAFGTISDAETPETTKADDSSQQDAKVDSVNCEDTSSVVSCLPTHEHEEADNLSIHGEKSDATVKANKIADAESESKVQGAEEIYETDKSLTVGEPVTNDIEEQIRDAPEVLCEPITQGVKSECKDETIPVQTLQAEKIEEQLQMSSSDLLPKDEDGKTTTIVEKTEDECTKKDDEEVDTNEIEEETDDASKAVSKPINQGVEATSKDENIPSQALQRETIEEFLVDTNEIEEQTGDALEALYKLINQGVEAASNDEIAPGPSRPTLQAEKTEEQLQVSSSAMAFNEEDDETKTTIALTEDGCKRRDDTDANTNGVEEQTVDTSDSLSDPINQGVEATSKDESVPSPTPQGKTIEEHLVEMNEIEEQMGNALEALYELINRRVEAASNDEIAPSPTLQAEKTEEQLQVSSSAMVSKEEEDETQTTVAWTEDGCKRRDDTDADTNGVGEQTVDASETLYEPINQVVEADGNDEIALGPTIKAKETEEQLQVSSSVVLSKEKYGETETTVKRTEDGCTKKDETEVDNLELEETPSVVSQPLSTTWESANNAIVKSDTVQVDETKTLKAVSEPDDLGFEEIHESQKSPTAEITDTHEVVENGTTIEKIEGESTTNIEAEVDNIKLEEATAMLSKFPTTENEVLDNENATAEKSEGNEFEVEEAKFSDVVSESELHGAAKESPKEDETQPNEKAADSIEEGATEKPSLQNEEPRELDVSTTENKVVDKESATVEKSEGNEFHIEEAKISDAVSESELHGAAKESTKEDETQLNKKAADSFEAGATEKLSLQYEERELDVSNFDQMAQKDSQDQAPEQERRSLEDDSEVKPQGYIPEAKYAAFASEHEKTPAYCSSKDTSKDENAIDLPPPHPTIKELSTEEGEAIKNNTSVEKTINQGELQQITEEKEATRISHPVSPHEETVTKTNQENGLLDSPKREDEITAEPYQGEKCATFDKQSDEIQCEELFDKQTAAATASIAGGKNIQIENHTMDEDTVELSTNGNDSDLLESKIHIATTPNGDEESQHLNEKPNVLSDGKDTEVSHEKTITAYEVTKDAKELEKGVEYGEEKKLGEGCQKTAERSILMDTNKSSQKKSQGILSGVGSKVKHSIAKVKKVITGKSSHPKTSSLVEPAFHKGLGMGDVASPNKRGQLVPHPFHYVMFTRGWLPIPIRIVNTGRSCKFTNEEDTARHHCPT